MHTVELLRDSLACHKTICNYVSAGLAACLLLLTNQTVCETRGVGCLPSGVLVQQCFWWAHSTPQPPFLAFWLSMLFLLRDFLAFWGRFFLSFPKGCSSLQGGASFKGEKAHFAAWKKGSGEPWKWSKIAPPSVPPPEALYDYPRIMRLGLEKNLVFFSGISLFFFCKKKNQQGKEDQGLLRGACWAHDASQMANLGESLLLCILQCFRAWESMPPPSSCRTSHSSSRCVVSSRSHRASSLSPKSHLRPLPHLGLFDCTWHRCWCWLTLRPIFIECGCWELCSLSMRVANCSPTLDKNLTPIGPEVLSSSRAGVWRRAPGVLPDSSPVLDKFQSAIYLESQY